MNRKIKFLKLAIEDQDYVLVFSFIAAVLIVVIVAWMIAGNRVLAVLVILYYLLWWEDVFVEDNEKK